jgi:hypothetical protein
MCAYGALILCDGHVALDGPLRGHHCPCAAEELAERGLSRSDELHCADVRLDVDQVLVEG